ncbi:probable ubiquitin carboxyl-terminal hydrolase FAF-X isoform X2 [Penaeus chinensis]|uniref:probable ubiquitin carboxyl-terminal hydrolase FAF-X isoform X2 n=1 Tax=Penaeus chinensis TaxID=139456 RepID=UPI001FB5C2FD|nr:probable ubiquitin carboxyl-terminal hydrolase FAF-X isoform X2 [Penaeus chinensis]
MTIAMIANQDPQEGPPNTPPQGGDGEVLGEGEGEEMGAGEPDFPLAALARLDEMIHRQRWVVPVLPKCELELLLDASIDLCTRGLDTRSEACQRFFREGLTISFTKILTDEAVNSWKFEIHRCILKNCEKLIELVVVKLHQDWFPLLDLLAMVLNPNSKFHTFNGTRPSETVPQGSQIPDSELFARPPDPRNPRGWLVDLINLFGKHGGFQILLERFQSGKNLSVPVICALLRPFGLCYEMLTIPTIEKYFMSIVEVVPAFLENLTDDELKKEAKNEAKNDALSAIIKAIKCLVSRVPSQEETAKNLEIFRLKMILRLLQISSFNGKMNALNEVNKVITNVSYYSHRHGPFEEEEWLTAERMAEWIKENRVLQIVLRDSLHQPQYVEKLEKIIRFIIKEKALTLEDLDDIWAAQHGKHEAIVKNVHDLLAKLAWDFSPEQLDHLFGCFQTSWSQASKKQREKLLELIRRLAEDDKDGVMAHKVLTLLWSLAHSDDVPTEIMDQALNAHVKILDYSCSQDRDTQKKHWLDRCVEELKHDKWVLPALKQIREICCSYSEAPPNFSQHQRPTPHVSYRHDVISKLQNQHSLVVLVADNLTTYMKNIRLAAKENPDLNPAEIIPDGRYNHICQVQERLNFLRFLLKDGQLWLCAPQAKQIWNCLAENAVFTVDRESCFKWFSKLMGDEPDLDPEINKDFFENNILLLDPSLLTENGMKCFDRFFKAVNSKEGKLVLKKRVYLMDDVDLIGVDYVWRVVLCGTEDIASRAIELLRETFTNLGPRLQANQVIIHDDFLSSCMSRLKAMYDTVSVLDRDKDSVNRIRQETTRMCRVLKVLYEYVSECDGDFGDDRSILPLGRSSRGKHLSLLVRFPVQGRQPDELDVWTHTNDTMGAIRRQVLHRLKSTAPNVKVELYLNTDPIDPVDDKKIIAHMPLRDKMVLTAKLVQVGSNMPSSPDSSSDSSTGSPQHPYEGPNVDAENCLPGVIMSGQGKYTQFLLQLADLGCTLQLPQLRDSARALLEIMPADQYTVNNLRTLCMEHAKIGDQNMSPSLESIVFSPSPSQVLYNLQVLYSLLMPAHNPMSEKAHEFQYNFMKSGGVKLIIDMLSKNNFLSNTDMPTKRSAFLVVLKLAKLAFVTVGYAIVGVVAGAVTSSGTTTTGSNGGSEGSSPTGAVSLAASTHTQALVLQEALHHIPNPASDCMVRNVASRLAQSLHDQVTITSCLWAHFVTGVVPDMSVVRAILKITWASAAGQGHLITSSLDEIEKAAERPPTKPPDPEDLCVCREGLETLSVVLALYPPALETLTKDTQFHKLVMGLVLVGGERSIRQCAVEQLLLMATKCSNSPHTLVVFIVMLFNVLNGLNSEYSKEYFQLLCGLLNWACVSSVTVTGVDRLLTTEVEWLKNVRASVAQMAQGGPEPPVDETLLEGHLCVTRELVAFLPPEKKYEIGGDPSKGIFLIRELVEDFIFPFSKVYLQLEHAAEMPAEQAIPVCSTQPTVIAAYELLVTLCTGCVPNLKLLAEMLTNMYYSDCDESIGEWEYLPPVGPRPMKGFVGLKNAGATCYMNSVLQQLYMIRQIRHGVLAVEGAATDPEEDFSGEERMEQETNLDGNEDDAMSSSSNEESRKEYHIGILKQVQAIFAHLACSKLQYYVPRGLWKHFKLQGEPVNLREQHDACEFYNILVESLNEALKALGHEQIMNKILGGSYSDQKICKTCPHRYSREETFTVISIDIRNYSNLYDSLEQYVKGDLLEGDNAYLCEKCDKKVDTVKRICLKKLPPILAIQLKRFDYDWERECSIKFNDYFEFPRELDMDPYTVAGLARNGELIDYDPEDMKTVICSKYKLTGIVVHSGQASGGHYYSYILHRNGNDQRWYKFDDGEVTECKMDDEEEMKNQCFGGEYMGEQVFDNIMKRVSYRRQKRWWNAYLLFYTRLDVEEDNLCNSINELSIERPGLIKMPNAIERSVVRQNVRFMHSRSQFSPEYFQFLKKLILTNQPYVLPAPQDRIVESEEIAMISTQLCSKFLFSVGLHTKKTLRGPAPEWYDALQVHLRASVHTRAWFAQQILFAQPHRFVEYLLECPAPEVRMVFSKLIVLVAHCARNDGPQPLGWGPLKHHPGLDMASGSCTLSDQLLVAVLQLLNKDVSEHGRHLTQYFHLFNLYASLGPPEKLQLLKLNVVEMFMLVALDEGPGPAIKYQYAELGRLYQVVSQLIRSCDVSPKQQSSQPNTAPLPNPHGDPACAEPLMPIQPKVVEILYGRATYVKKIIEDANSSEDTVKLLKFCCWENPLFSSTVLSELLWQIAYSYTYELRPYLDLLLHMLLLDDSWQNHRIHNALKGIPDDREGLFDTIQRSKNHYQKRAYQCIKCMVALFSSCPAAQQMLHSNGDLKRKWTWAVDWLNDELDRRPYAAANQQYGFSNWSPPAQSNETSNGYFLERSPSARSTLEKAYELCPEDEPEAEEGEEAEVAVPEEVAPLPPVSDPAQQQQQQQQQQPQPQQQQQQQPQPQQQQPQQQQQPGQQQQQPQKLPPTSGPQPCSSQLNSTKDSPVSTQNRSHSGGSLTVNSGNSSNTNIGDNSAPNNPSTTTVPATTVVGAPTASTTTTTNTTSSQGGNQTTTTSINTSISSITSSSSSSSTTTNSTNNVGGTNKTSTPSPQSTPNLPPSMQENPQEN